MTEIASPLTDNLVDEVAAAEEITASARPIMAESTKEPEAPKKPLSGKQKYSAEKSCEDEKKAAWELRKCAS